MGRKDRDTFLPNEGVDIIDDSDRLLPYVNSNLVGDLDILMQVLDVTIFVD